MKRLLCLFYMLCVAVAQAQPADSEAALTRLAENVQRFVLSNGLRVVIYRRDIAPVFSGVVKVKVGGVDEQPGSTGIAHMFEHMAFKGTRTIGTIDYAREKPLLEALEQIMTDYPAGAELPAEVKSRLDEINSRLESLWKSEEFSAEFERRGAVGFNAATSSDATWYTSSLPSRELEFWCRTESERLLNPVMRQFYTERDVVLEERRMRVVDDPGGRLWENFAETAFAGLPYGRPVIGFEADIRGLTAARLEEFRRRHYVPGNMVIGLVGDIDPQAGIQLVRRYFERLPAGPVAPVPEAGRPALAGQQEVVLKAQASPRLLIGYRKPVYPHPDASAISVMLAVLAGEKTALLQRELAQNQKLVSSLEYGEEPGERYDNLAVFGLNTRSPHTNQEVLREFDRLIEQFKSKGASAGELEASKRRIAVAYLKGLQSSPVLADDLAESELLYGGWEATIKWYEEVMKLQVDDINRVARKYLNQANRTIGRLERGEG